MENNAESIKEEFYKQFLEEVEVARKNIIKINNQIKEEKAIPEEIDVSSFDINKVKNKQYELYRKISELQEQIEKHGTSPLVKGWENELSINKSELAKTQSLIEKLEMPKSKKIEMLEQQKQEEVRVPKIKVDNLIKSTQTEISQSETTYKDLEEQLKKQTKLYMSLEVPAGKSRREAFPEQYEACEKIAEKLKKEKSKLTEKYKKLDNLEEIKERIDSFLLEEQKSSSENEEELEELEPRGKGGSLNKGQQNYDKLVIDNKQVIYLDNSGEKVAEMPKEELSQEKFEEILDKNRLQGFKDLDLEDVDGNLVMAFSDDKETLMKYLGLIQENPAINKEELAKSLVDIEYDLTNLRKDEDMTIEEKLELYRQAKATRNLFKNFNSKNGKINISLFDKAYFEMRNIVDKIKNTTKKEELLAIEAAKEPNIRRNMKKVKIDHSAAQENANSQEKSEPDKDNVK